VFLSAYIRLFKRHYWTAFSIPEMITAFCDDALWSAGETCYLNLQDRSAWFYSENGFSTFHQNVSENKPDYKGPHPGILYSSLHNRNLYEYRRRKHEQAQHSANAVCFIAKRLAMATEKLHIYIPGQVRSKRMQMVLVHKIF
jgi:hypothetical protein